MVKAPIKFGSEGSLAEVAGDVPRGGPKRDSKSPELGLAMPAAAAASLGGRSTSECFAEKANVVPPTLASHTPSSTSGDATAGASSARVAPSGTGADGASATAVSADPSAATASSAAHGATAQYQAPPVKRKPAAAAGSKRNIRTIRFRGGGYPASSGAARPPPAGAADAAAAAAVAAAAPFSREMHPTMLTSDSLAAVAAAAGTEAPTSPKENMFATAAVAKRAVDSLFDTAALKLSAAPPSKAAAAKGKPPTGTSKGAALPAGVARDIKPKAAAAAAPAAAVAERLLPFGAEVTDGVTTRDVFEAASSRSWISGGGAAEEGPRGALTAVLATAQALMEKVRK